MDADVVVIGGGSAGLQAALTLGRMRFDVVVVDAGEPSNAPAHAIGGLLGAHDLAPTDLLATGRAQLAELPTVRVIEAEAASVEPDRGVTLADGTALVGPRRRPRHRRRLRLPGGPRPGRAVGDVRDPLPVLSRVGVA